MDTVRKAPTTADIGRLLVSEQPVRRVLVPTLGRDVVVKLVDALAYKLVRQYRETEDHALVWEILKRCLADVPPEAVDTLPLDEAMTLFTVATGTADEVLAILGNADGSSAPPAAAPAPDPPAVTRPRRSSRTTRSRASASASGGSAAAT